MPLPRNPWSGIGLGTVLVLAIAVVMIVVASEMMRVKMSAPQMPGYQWNAPAGPQTR
ncbi:MAG: hypothetical protein LBQ09_03700 [Acidobacteriaceae bacterium]|jgi:hypothetical protein|nr:hypothetical protein [Acidobacteriaceae bacterium]